MLVDEAQQLVRQSESAKEVVENARQSVRRLRQHYEQLTSSSSSPSPFAAARASTPQPDDRAMSPVRQLRLGLRATPPPASKEAQARMEEMQRLIGRRAVESRPRPLSIATEPLVIMKTPEHSHHRDGSKAEDVARSMDELAAHVDSDLAQVAHSMDQVHGEIERLASTLGDKTEDLDRSKNELANAKLQITLVKQLYDDCTAEKDALYELFNEELDGMFNEASLPEDEAWTALTRDLTESKKARNEAERLNTQLRRELAEAEIQNQSYAALLRAHGLIS